MRGQGPHLGSPTSPQPQAEAGSRPPWKGPALTRVGRWVSRAAHREDHACGAPWDSLACALPPGPCEAGSKRAPAPSPGSHPSRLPHASLARGQQLFALQPRAQPPGARSGAALGSPQCPRPAVPTAGRGRRRPWEGADGSASSPSWAAVPSPGSGSLRVCVCVMGLTRDAFRPGDLDLTCEQRTRG